MSDAAERPDATEVVRIDDDHVMANPWGVDLAQHTSVLKIVSERLSIVRYVFLVQIEDGISSAAQRASLEYADAVLIGWPDEDAPDLTAVSDEQYRDALAQVALMEDYIDRFRAMERRADIDGMTDTLIRITERVAHVRRTFQPKFLLPTFAEIRRVVQDEWDEDMGRLDRDGDGEPDSEAIRSLQDEFETLLDDGGDDAPADGGERA